MKMNLAIRGLASAALALILQTLASAAWADGPAPQIAVQPVQGEAPSQRPATTETLPQVEYDLSKLPPAVQDLRQRIIEAASTGDVEKLRPMFDKNGGPPHVSCESFDDPVNCLRSLSGDPAGREKLANLISALEAGYVHVAKGTPDEMYVWPYFALYPVARLTPCS